MCPLIYDVKYLEKIQSILYDFNSFFIDSEILIKTIFLGLDVLIIFIINKMMLLSLLLKYLRSIDILFNFFVYKSHFFLKSMQL